MATSGTKGQMRQISADLNALKQAVARSASSSKRNSKKSKKNKSAAASVTGSSERIYRELPVARGFAGRATTFRTSPLPQHRDFGPGIRVIGCEVALNVVTAAAAADFFTGNIALTATANSMVVSPDTFNGRLALIARTFTRFRFRKLVAHFVPALGTANPGMGCICYVDDGSNAFYTPSFSFACQTVPSVVFSLNAPASLKLIDYKGDEAYWVELDSASSASLRQTTQGIIYGFPSSNTLGVLTQGLVWLEYEVELYGPVMDYGFTVSLRSEEEKSYIAKELCKFRRLKCETPELIRR